MPTNFYGLVGYDRVKNYPLWLKSVYPRSTTAVSALYTWCTHAQISFFPTYPLLSADQFPLCTTNPDLFLIGSLTGFMRYFICRVVLKNWRHLHSFLIVLPYCARLFFILYVVFSFLLSRAHDFFRMSFFFLLSRANHLLIYFLVKRCARATGSWSPSPLIVSRDSFSLWTWARVQTARSTAYFNGCPYIFDILLSY